jgi:hypothetical protein
MRSEGRGCSPSCKVGCVTEMSRDYFGIGFETVVLPRQAQASAAKWRKRKEGDPNGWSFFTAGNEAMAALQRGLQMAVAADPLHAEGASAAAAGGAGVVQSEEIVQ